MLQAFVRLAAVIFHGLITHRISATADNHSFRLLPFSLGVFWKETLPMKALEGEGEKTLGEGVQGLFYLCPPATIYFLLRKMRKRTNFPSSLVYICFIITLLLPFW